MEDKDSEMESELSQLGGEKSRPQRRLREASDWGNANSTVSAPPAIARPDYLTGKFVSNYVWLPTMQEYMGYMVKQYEPEHFWFSALRIR